MGCVQSVTGKIYCDPNKQRDDSSRRPNPFVNPITKATKSQELKFKKCSNTSSGDECKDKYEYVYQPKTDKTCGQFRKEFNIPPSYEILGCTNNEDQLHVATIPVKDLENFVNNQIGW